MSTETRNSPRATPYVELTSVADNAPADGSTSNSVRARIINSEGNPVTDQNYRVDLDITNGSAIFLDTKQHDTSTFVDPANNGYTPAVAFTDTAAESVVVTGSVFFPVGVDPGRKTFTFTQPKEYEVIFDPVPGNGTTPADGRSLLNVRVRVLKNGHGYKGGVTLRIDDTLVSIAGVQQNRIFFRQSGTQSLHVETDNDGYTPQIPLYSTEWESISNDGSTISTIVAKPDDSATTAQQIVAFGSKDAWRLSVNVEARPNPASTTEQCHLSVYAEFDGKIMHGARHIGLAAYKEIYERLVIGPPEPYLGNNALFIKDAAAEKFDLFVAVFTPRVASANTGFVATWHPVSLAFIK